MIPRKRCVARRGCDLKGYSRFDRYCVYLASCRVDGGQLLCKVGMSSYSGQARVSCIKSRVYPWELIASVSCCCKSHAKELERDIHLILYSRDLGGERFHLQEHELSFLAGLFVELDRQSKANRDKFNGLRTIGEQIRMMEDASARWDFLPALACAAGFPQKETTGVSQYVTG